MKIELTQQQAAHVGRLLRLDLLIYEACKSEVQTRLFTDRIGLNRRVLAKLEPKKRVKASKAQKRILRLRRA